MRRKTLFVAVVVVVVALLALAATAMAILPKATLTVTRPLAGATVAEDTTFTVAGGVYFPGPPC